MRDGSPCGHRDRVGALGDRGDHGHVVSLASLCQSLHHCQPQVLEQWEVRVLGQHPSLLVVVSGFDMRGREGPRKGTTGAITGGWPLTTGPSLDSNSSYRTSGRQQAFHTLAVLTGWLPFEGQHNVRTGREVSGHHWRHTADREPTCVTGEAGHYSRTLASKAGNHSRHLLLVRKTLEDALMEIADQERLAGDGEVWRSPNGGSVHRKCRRFQVGATSSLHCLLSRVLMQGSITVVDERR